MEELYTDQLNIFNFYIPNFLLGDLFFKDLGRENCCSWHAKK